MIRVYRIYSYLLWTHSLQAYKLQIFEAKFTCSYEFIHWKIHPRKLIPMTFNTLKNEPPWQTAKILPTKFNTCTVDKQKILHLLRLRYSH